MFDNLPVFPLETPALRPLQIMPVEIRGQQFLMAQDPMGLLAGPALLVPDPLLIVFLQMANGRTTLGEMAQRLTEATGQIIPTGMFERMTQQLDEALLLQSERYVQALRARHEEYAKMPNRPYKTVAAKGKDRLAMLKELGDEFRRHTMSPLSPPAELDLPRGSVTAILAPHIDYARGGEAYAWAYRALKDCGTNARTFIVLGTSHRPAGAPFVATRKNYDTPFGLVETDTALLDEIAAAYGHELFVDEYLHADEHTIELQAIYLKRVLGDREFRIVPILVDSFCDYTAHGEGSPMQYPEVADFVRTLRTVLDKHGDSVALIGGVDFSHCGPEFGHEQPNDAARVKEIETGDREALAAITAIDAEKFLETFRRDENARNVCSIATIWTVLEVMKGRANARVLSYQQANSTDKNSLVSFAAVAFTKPGAQAENRPRIILATR